VKLTEVATTVPDGLRLLPIDRLHLPNCLPLGLQVVRPLPDNTSPVCCNLSTLYMAGLDTYAAGLTPAGDPVSGSSSPLPANASGSLPPGCGSCEGPSATAPPSDPATAETLLSEPAAGSFPAPPARFVHVGDLGITGTLATKCSRHGDTLRVAAAAAASSQDAVATGLEGRAFLSDPPPLVSVPEIWLSAVAALQGLVALFYMLFLPKDGGWVAHQVWAAGNGEVPPRQQRIGRSVLIALALILAVYVKLRHGHWASGACWFHGLSELRAMACFLWHETTCSLWHGCHAHVVLDTHHWGSCCQCQC